MEKKSVKIFLMLCILVCLAGMGIIFATKENSLEFGSGDVNHSVLEAKYETCLEIKDIEEENSPSIEKTPERPSTSAQSILNKSALNTEEIAPHTSLNTGTLLNIKEQEQTVRENIPFNFVNKEAEISTENAPSTEPVFTKYNDLNELIKKESVISGIENKTSPNPLENNSQELAPVPVRNPKEELIEMLECIVKRNPSLDPKTQKIYNDIYTINALLINRNTVVLENLRLSSINVVEKITLWEVLQACKEGKSIDIDVSSSDPIMWIIFYYPNDLLYIPLIVHAIFTYYTPKNISNITISILKFNFEFNINVLNEFQIFKEVKSITIAKSHIYSNTLNILKDFSNLKVLYISKGLILNIGDACIIPTLPTTLERLQISDIDKYNVNWMLSELDSWDNIKEIDISRVNFMDTFVLNKLKTLSKITSFRLKDIVFAGAPNFSFLKQMSELNQLFMCNIFYSYTEKFELNELDKIKSNLAYLFPDIIEKKVMVEYAYLAKENRMVGDYISPMNIIVDSKLYADLRLRRIECKAGKPYNIRIEFVNSMDHLLANSVGLQFTLNDTHSCLDIKVEPKAAVNPKSLLLENLKNIKFPFLQIKTIETIHLESSLNNKSEKSAIMDILSHQIMKYAKNNKIKNIKLVSLVPAARIDIRKLDLFNRIVPSLEILKLSNIIFTTKYIIPKNMDEKNILKTCKKYIKNNPNNAIGSYLFSKKQNNLTLVGNL
ncbi:hypothetical protein NEPAR04_1449 [Nematocida parisii]|nr:hypothetical protein NEPAR04_1449 [Nematocida parisii]